MDASFARFPRNRHVMRLVAAPMPYFVLLVTMLAGCATLPPPTAEIDAALAAVVAAEAADADQHAAREIDLARDALVRAQAAMSAGEDDEARKLAHAAAATADLARALSRASAAESLLAERLAAIADLSARLGLDGGAGVSAPLPALPPMGDADSAGGLAQRLALLDADPRLQGHAAYERLRARQALDALLAADRGDRDDARYVANVRVQAAEIAARGEAMRAEAMALELEHSQLMVEASRREAEEARQEAARLRLEAQVRAEEAARLRAAAAEATAARIAAEEVILEVGGDQADRLREARELEAELARQEAELLRQAAEAEAAAEAAEEEADPA
ncbi:MAG TPA: DUF4398 domain-containing protein [Xanthomonadaceae bacterium]|nr:DUF4398 domain-containing protein [Xanthomonadaceae bacterium]